MSLARADIADLHDALSAVRAGHTTAQAAMADSLQAAQSPPCRAAFVRRFDAMAMAAARAADSALASGAPLPPLGGLAVSVKDLFDVAGWPTTAASRSLHDAPPAAADALAVARLRAAGAALVGHTNLSEHAFSGVGLNPHHGTPNNVAAQSLRLEPRVPGGSTSGGATSVAAQAAWAALGSDTGGSIRIPAALQGLVGFKPTQDSALLAGCRPLSPTLDTTCAITRSVRDAVLLHEVLCARRVAVDGRQAQGWRLALPRHLMLEGLDAEVDAAFWSAVESLRRAGLQVVEIELPELCELAGINAKGGFAAAESWALHRARLAERGEQYDPRVAQRIRRGAAMDAADYFDLLQRRRHWAARVGARLAGFDAALSPTVPLVAPPLAPLLEDDTAFFEVNARLLRNPSVVNLLDGAAISLPCQPQGALPVGLMLWGPADSDDRLLSLAGRVEAALAHGGR